MLKIGVIIDNYKLSIFKKHFKKAGFKFKVRPGITPDTLNLKVNVETVEELQPIVQAAYDEAAGIGTLH